MPGPAAGAPPRARARAGDGAAGREPRGNHRRPKRLDRRAPAAHRLALSATPLHPPLHEKMERSKGRRGVADTGA